MVKISKSVAEWILGLGKKLISDAFNSKWDPLNPMNLVRNAPESTDIPTPGFMDELSDVDPDMRNWLHAMIQFIRSVTAIVANELQEEQDEEVSARIGQIVETMMEDKEN